MVNELPIYKIRNNFYFLDKRLGEYRNIKNPHDKIDSFSVTSSDLQTPTQKDRENIFGKLKKATTIQEIHNELMRTSKSFRESTPRSRETRVKRVHTLRMNKALKKENPFKKKSIKPRNKPASFKGSDISGRARRVR